MQGTNPYLTCKDAAAAIDFYKQAFGAQEAHRMPADDGRRIMHAELHIAGGLVMLSDEFPEYCEAGAPSGPTKDAPASVATVIHLTEPKQVDETFQRATDAGAAATMAPHDAFWGARFAALVDPFGHRWMLTAPHPQAQR